MLLMSCCALYCYLANFFYQQLKTQSTTKSQPEGIEYVQAQADGNIDPPFPLSHAGMHWHKQHRAVSDPCQSHASSRPALDLVIYEWLRAEGTTHSAFSLNQTL